MARANLEVLEWDELGLTPSIEDQQHFLDEFPDGKFAQEAKRRLDALEAELQKERQAEELQRQETEAWAAASSGDIDTVNAFLAKWPQGQHAVAAQARTRELRRAKLLSGWGAIASRPFVVGLVTACALAFMGYIVGQGRNPSPEPAVKTTIRGVDRPLPSGRCRNMSFEECQYVERCEWRGDGRAARCHERW